MLECSKKKRRVDDDDEAAGTVLDGAAGDVERFKTLDECRAYVMEKMQEHGLTPRWTFEFNKKPSLVYGSCESPPSCRILLSEAFATKGNMADVKDSVLHEIAHALVGAYRYHDAVWRAKAISIGGTGVENPYYGYFYKPLHLFVCEHGCSFPSYVEDNIYEEILSGARLCVKHQKRMVIEITLDRDEE